MTDDLRAAIYAEVRTLGVYKRAVAGGMAEEDALRACTEGMIVARLATVLDHIAAARKMLREGNLSGAMMYLDLCKDPREGSK